MHSRHGVLAIVIVAAVVVSAGCSSEDRTTSGYEIEFCSESDDLNARDGCRQKAWASRTGQDWREFATFYEGMWNSGCDIAFDTPNRNLYDGDARFSVRECFSANPGGPANSPSLPVKYPPLPEDAATAAATHDVCVYAFEQLASDGELYWGDDSFDASICPDA